MKNKIILSILTSIYAILLINITAFANPIEDAQTKLDVAKKELQEAQSKSVGFSDIVSGDIISVTPYFIIEGTSLLHGSDLMIITNPIDSCNIMGMSYIMAPHSYKGKQIIDGKTYMLFGEAPQDSPELTEKINNLKAKVEQYEKELEEANTGYRYEGDKNALGEANGKGKLVYNNGKVIEGFFNKNVEVNLEEVTIEGCPTFFIDNEYIVNKYGELVKIDAPPTVIDGRTLIPLRVLGDEMGAVTNWDAGDRRVDVTESGISVTLWIGKTTALVNGSEKQLDVAPQIINGRTFVPVRFIAESFFMEVEWFEIYKAMQLLIPVG